MKTVIKKHLDVEKIERIACENNYDEQAYNLFLREVENNLIRELFQGFTDKSETIILSKVVEIMSEVQGLRKKGFGFEWAAEYVCRSHSSEKVHAATYAFLAADEAQDYELESLKLYAQLTGRDENFVYYFNLLLVEPDYLDIFNEPIEKSADNYSNTIKKLIAEGKSIHYAKLYAFFSTNYVYPPYICHMAGMEAERADEKEIEDLIDYAEDMSRYIYDNFDVYEDSLNDEKANQMRKKYAKYLS